MGYRAEAGYLEQVRELPDVNDGLGSGWGAAGGSREES
jgi:hypothetical protein